MVDQNVNRAAEQVSLLNRAQEHRGPDHGTVSTVGAFTIGNTRLAIQDPTPAGNQPFISPDGRYYCVFNGEIYNHRQLVERYRLQVRTGCDGEVIPQLWAKLGPAALGELRGMFAIALVDSLQELLYLARDPLGIKPLHWRVLPDGRVAFASEVRPLAGLAMPLQIDSEAVARYLHLGAMAADQSPFRDITALPPNSVATVSKSGKVTRQEIAIDPLAVGGIADLGEALVDSVELHLDADVPTVLLLSAGVDSATIAAVSRRLGKDLQCVTVATHGAADESNEAAETARHYGHAFTRVPAVLEEGDVAAFFRAMQRPSIDGLNTYLVSKAVHEAGFKVALSGLGGDEVVGGYSHFRLLRYLRVLRLWDLLPGVLTTGTARSLARMGVSGEAKAKSLLGRGGPRGGWGLSLLQREVLPAATVTELTGIEHCSPDYLGRRRSLQSGASFEVMARAEVQIYLQAMLLPDADAFSMASSVELRVPFVDSQVFSASLRLAAGQVASPGKKSIARAVGDPYLAHLARQRKRGFSLPMRHWMTGPLGPALRSADEPGAAVWSVLDRGAAQRLGLVPIRARERWAEAWILTALNAWLTSVEAGAGG
jgi:asparagine synthase (glutamine-hydrolysing)